MDEVIKYVEEAIESFVKDPPDSPYQRGYLDALLVIWDEALEMPANATIDEARNLIVGPIN